MFKRAESSLINEKVPSGTNFHLPPIATHHKANCLKQAVLAQFLWSGPTHTTVPSSHRKIILNLQKKLAPQLWWTWLNKFLRRIKQCFVCNNMHLWYSMILLQVLICGLTGLAIYLDAYLWRDHRYTTRKMMRRLNLRQSLEDARLGSWTVDLQSSQSMMSSTQAPYARASKVSVLRPQYYR